MLKKKRVTMSNWERPLNSQQLEYAALDSYVRILCTESYYRKLLES